METKILVLAIFAIFAAIVKESAAVKCYECSIIDDKCKDKFDTGAGVDTAECPNGCMKSKSELNGVQSVMRGCAPVKITEDKCDSVELEGAEGTGCFCKGNLCNSATMTAASITGLAFLVATIIFCKTLY